MKQRKLLIVTFSYLSRGGGGVESWLQKFLTNTFYLDSIYGEYEVIGLNDGSESFVSDIINDKIFFNLVHVKQHSSIQILPSFLRCVTSSVKKTTESLDIIYVGSNYPSLPILFIKKKPNTRHFIWLRSFFPKEIFSTGMKHFKKLFLTLEHLCLKRADSIIANGYDTKELYEHYYNDIPQICVIPNGVDRRLVVENKNALESTKLNIAFIGRLEKNKGFDIFCESIKQLNRYTEEFRNTFCFYIVGYGSLQSDAELLCEQYENVKFLGKLSNSEVYSFLQQIDCSVNLTLFSDKLGGSGLSNSLIESIFAKNLIIAYDNIIFRQILTAENAILVEEGNIDALINAYIFIEKNRIKCKKKISNAFETAKIYDFENHMHLFYNLINKKVL